MTIFILYSIDISRLLLYNIIDIKCESMVNFMTLVILAAGMGSRFGGMKQITPVGPSGEFIIDYSVYDAIKAGFDKVVFVIKKAIEKDFKELGGNRIEKKGKVEYVFQDMENLPDGFSVPDERTKPWGTGHAVLCCADIVNEPFAVINQGVPYFEEGDMTTESYETYADLDYLGRCGETMACIGRDLMPTEARESISQVKPTGWKQKQYDFVDGKSLYNRCHLIGFQLTGENANERNLITGTRYMNTEGMLPFENMVADYIKETGNHVLYRVTPIFRDDELVARGVQMEAYSVEDSGEGICFCVYVYNNQPGVTIDYATGDSWQESK